MNPPLNPFQRSTAPPVVPAAKPVNAGSGATQLDPPPANQPVESKKSPPPLTLLSIGRVRLLFWFFLVMSIVLFGLLLMLWPEYAEDGKKWCNKVWYSCEKSCEIGPEKRLLLLVLVSAAFGSFVHAATSFVTFHGLRELGESWMLWYLLRPAIGMALAFLVYLFIRGGLVGGSATVEALNPYAIIALAGASGMFSQQASEKIREIFDTIFRVSDKVKFARPHDNDRTGQQAPASKEG